LSRRSSFFQPGVLRHARTLNPHRADIPRRTDIPRVIDIVRLKRDEIGMNRHRALAHYLRMIFSENRFTLFRIML
jgi:hypothetical protein